MATEKISLPSSSFFKACTTGLKRSTCPTQLLIPAASTALKISFASSTVEAAGFSIKICTPLAAHFKATSLCKKVGTAMMTASGFAVSSISFTS